MSDYVDTKQCVSRSTHHHPPVKVVGCCVMSRKQLPFNIQNAIKMYRRVICERRLSREIVLCRRVFNPVPAPESVLRVFAG